MPRTFYHVAPRFTAGSPSMVDEETAARVAADELNAAAAIVDGLLGAEELERLGREGVEGIAYATSESRRSQYVYDLITGEHFVVPNKEWEGQHWHRRDDRAKFCPSRGEREFWRAEANLPKLPARVRLTALGVSRVLDGAVGMEFPVDKFTVGSMGPVAHVKDTRRENRSLGRPFAIWSLGFDDYELVGN